MENINNNNLREQVQTVGTVPCGSLVPDNVGRVLNHKQRSRPSEAAFKKAHAFWAKQNERRRTPGNCSRCGKPLDTAGAKCIRCREYQAQYKLRKRIENTPQIVLDASKHERLVKRIESLELAVARLQVKDRQMYKRGFRLGQRIEQKRRLAEDMPEITKQELSTMNHAYAGYRE